MPFEGVVVQTDKTVVVWVGQQQFPEESGVGGGVKSIMGTRISKLRFIGGENSRGWGMF